MNKIKFFAMALAALAIVSCSKEDVNGDNNEPGGSGEPTYATFSFKTGAALSKATGLGNENDEGKGTDKDLTEMAIKTARLLIFSTGITEALENNRKITFDDGADKKFSELVKSGDKKMFVIANETTAMETELDKLKPGANLSEFLKLTYDAGTPNSDDFTLLPLHTKSVDKGFPMSSPNDKLYKFLEKVTKEQAEAGTSNAFTLEMDYMLSKVTVIAATTVFDNTTFKVADMKFAIRNIAKKTYLTQQFVDAGAKIVKGVYYDELPKLSNTPAAWASFYHQSPLPVIPVTATATGATFVYTAENTKSTATLLAGATTYATINCIIIPKSSYDGTDMKWNEDKLALGIAKPIADPTDIDGAKVGTTFIVTQVAIENIKAGTVFTSKEILNKALTIIKLKEKYVEGTTLIEDLAKDTDFQTYTNGVAWYRINIGDLDADSNKIIYGVKRGLKYTATINSISSFGFVRDDVAPETPVDQQTYIKATITAKGWDTAGSSTDL